MNVPLLSAMVVLVLFSGFFSASETAFSTANRTKLKTLAGDRNARARKVLKLIDSYPRLLSTILVLNNLVNITLSAIATLFFIELIENTSVATVVSTAVTTVAVLIFGEVSPKTLAKEMPERFAMFSCGIMNALCFLLTPVNFVFERWNKLLLKIFRIKKDETVTEEDLITIVTEAENVGGIDEDEGQIIRSAIEFNDLSVEDILTPRVDVVAVSINDTPDKIRRAFRSSGFSRLPVYKGTVDNVIGVINQKDFYENVLLEHKKLATIITSPKMVTPYMKISDLMKLLQSSKSHMAIVLDEYSGMLGVITLEDILEELVGDIWDEHDKVSEEITELSENCYKIDGTLSSVKLLSLSDTVLTEEEEEELPATAAGIVMREKESIPEIGEKIVYKNLLFEILDADSAHIETLKVTVLPENEEQE